MTVKPFSAIIDFCGQFFSSLKKWHRKIIPRLITAMFCRNGPLHYANMAREVLTEKRNRSSVMRVFTSKRFKSRTEYRRALETFIKTSKKYVKRGPWFLVFDGTSTKRGAFTKIANAIKYKENLTHAKGRPATKSHMFLMGVLILPDGSRLPLPRMSYYTKDYCAQTGRTHVSIVQLAVEMIRMAPIPAGTDVIVLADEYFEGRHVHAVCQELGYTYIMPVDSRRCATDKKGTRLSKTLYDRGLNIKRSDMDTIRLITGKENTVSYRRGSESNRKKQRVYHAYAEKRAVAGLGDVLVTYSRKKRTRKSGNNTESYRVFVSNNVSLSAADVVEYYEIRWQIELFFRELKSIIGFDDFRGGDFAAFERYIDVVLMGMLFLEHYRIQLIREQPNRKLRAQMERARTLTLIQHVRKAVDLEGVMHLLELSEASEEEKEALYAALEDIRRVA
jgi:hypothetical protein